MTIGEDEFVAAPEIPNPFFSHGHRPSLAMALDLLSSFSLIMIIDVHLAWSTKRTSSGLKPELLGVLRLYSYTYKRSEWFNFNCTAFT